MLVCSSKLCEWNCLRVLAVLHVRLQLCDATSNTRQSRRISQLRRSCHELPCVTHHPQTATQSITLLILCNVFFADVWILLNFFQTQLVRIGLLQVRFLIGTFWSKPKVKRKSSHRYIIKRRLNHNGFNFMG